MQDDGPKDDDESVTCRICHNLFYVEDGLERGDPVCHPCQIKELEARLSKETTMPPKVCKRCKRVFQLGYRAHPTINDCLQQAKIIAEAAQNEIFNKSLKQHTDRENALHIEISKLKDESTARVAALAVSLAEKQAGERPMSDTELLAMSNLVMVEMYSSRSPWGSGAGPIRQRVDAELKRRGLL